MGYGKSGGRDQSYFGRKARLPYALHAPAPSLETHPYCREDTLLEGAHVATLTLPEKVFKEDYKRITCKACLKKLTRNAQYAALLTKRGFLVGTWEWSSGGAKSEAAGEAASEAAGGEKVEGAGE